jgi:hypothetical protein
MSSPSPTASPPDVSGLSISAQLDRSHDGYDHAYFTAPSPYTMMTGTQQSFDGPYNNTVAAMGSKPGRGGLPTVCDIPICHLPNMFADGSRSRSSTGLINRLPPCLTIGLHLLRTSLVEVPHRRIIPGRRI